MQTILRMRTPKQLAILLILLAQSALLMSQQVAINTAPDIFATPKGLAEPSTTSNLWAAPNSSITTTTPNRIHPVVLVTIPHLPKPVAHAFWDRQNRVLFAANGAMAAADFAVTRQNLANHGKELNPVAGLFAGSTPGLATNFAMEAGGVIGVSYLFHKTGHHKLERVTSYLNLGASAFAVSYSLAHR